MEEYKAEIKNERIKEQIWRMEGYKAEIKNERIKEQIWRIEEKRCRMRLSESRDY